MVGRTAALSAIIAVGIIAALPQASAGPRPEDIYFRYHAAIRAAILCEHRKLEPKGYGDPEWNRIAANRSRMDHVIAERMPVELSSSRRLALIQAARAEVARVVEAQGCDAGQVQGWLWMFHTDLEPVLVE
jgi:hypothetical protein